MMKSTLREQDLRREFCKMIINETEIFGQRPNITGGAYSATCWSFILASPLIEAPWNLQTQRENNYSRVLARPMI